MGQTISVNSTNRAIYITSLDDSVSQIVVSDSAVTVNQVRPEPGWTVAALSGGRWVLRHRPNGVLTAHDGFTQTRIATLTAAISDSAVYTLYNNDDVYYIQVATSELKISASSMQLETPSLVLADRDAPALFTANLSNAGPGPISVIASDLKFAVSAVSTVVYNISFDSDDDDDEYTLTLTAQNGALDQVSKTTTVRFIQPARLLNPVRIAVNYMDRVKLSVDTFETRETLRALSGNISHIMLQLPANITINNSRQFTKLTRAELATAVVQMSGRKSTQVPYWLSMDGGLVYSVRNVMRVGPMPCFAGTSVVCVHVHGHSMQWKQVCKLSPDDQVLDVNGKWHPIRRIIRSEPVDVVMVQLPAHCLGHNRPNKPLSLTTNHRIMAPDLHGHVRNVPAGQLRSISAKSIRNINVYRTCLYHIETHEYTFILVNNVPVETFRHA